MRAKPEPLPGPPQRKAPAPPARAIPNIAPDTRDAVERSLTPETRRAIDEVLRLRRRQ